MGQALGAALGYIRKRWFRINEVHFGLRQSPLWWGSQGPCAHLCRGRCSLSGSIHVDGERGAHGWALSLQPQRLALVECPRVLWVTPVRVLSSYSLSMGRKVCPAPALGKPRYGFCMGSLVWRPHQAPDLPRANATLMRAGPVASYFGNGLGRGVPGPPLSFAFNLTC